MSDVSARCVAERACNAPSAQAALLGCYEAVASATRRMLDAARAGDWPAMREGGRDCEALMQRIEAMPAADCLLDAEGRRQRLAILGRVLRDDAKLRDLLEPTFGRVDRWLGRGERTHAAHDA